MARAHSQCWTGIEYQHTCQRPSGRACNEPGCDQDAGTLWGPYWCPEHDTERIDRIRAALENLAGER